METEKQKTPKMFTITGDWKLQSKQLKEDYTQLTDSDLKFERGKENDLLERVQKRLNKNREEVISIIRKVQTIKG